MTKHNTISTTAIPTTVPKTNSSPPRPMNPSALSQQLDQLSLDQKKHSTSPKRPSSKRKSKSDITHGGGGTNSPQPHQQPPTHTKRSPKAAKVNGAKQQFSTPSKPKSIPNGSAPNPVSQAYGGVAPELASHYAGPTFHSSPAPSSLPMPSFFSSKPKTSLQNEYDIEGGSPNQTTPVKTVRSLDGQALHDDSPLAPFFKADREEKSGLLRNRRHIANGSPTVRPASAGEFHEHLDLRSQSPLMWNDSPRKVNGRLDFKSKYGLVTFINLDHSTTELPFHMDLELENGNASRNHLGQRFRATTEPPADNRTGPLGRHKYSHNKQYSEHGANYQPQIASQSREADLESSTQTLKNLLSINSTPSRPLSSTHPFPNTEGPPSPSPVHHNRTQSAAQPLQRRPAPSTSASTTPRRIASTSGIPPLNHLSHPSNPHPVISNTSDTANTTNTDEDPNLKAEKHLRKLLNLSWYCTIILCTNYIFPFSVSSLGLHSIVFGSRRDLYSCMVVALVFGIYCMCDFAGAKGVLLCIDGMDLEGGCMCIDMV